MTGIIISTVVLLTALALSIGSFYRQCCIKKAHFKNGMNNYRYMSLIKTTAWGLMTLIILTFFVIEIFGNNNSGNLFLTYTLTEAILFFFFNVLILVVSWLDFLFFKGSKFSFLDPNKYHTKHD